MCIAAPARIIEIEAGSALIELDGRRRRASLLRAPAVAVGDWALVAAGSVLRRLEPEEAAELAELLRPARLATTDPADQDAAHPGGESR
ncbi:MAG TPA: HypC/HybG/HupF family hydrogenase formation chaperone [Patescibacteria group bacterium]|jgi:hydrogenase expression/formation protein HypC|nr:HypC/HybG/HupF family hydrogenase formation chaperone [Patescibacteria group bacterium]